MHQYLNIIPCSSCQKLYNTYNKNYIHFVLNHGYNLKKSKVDIKERSNTQANKEATQTGSNKSSITENNLRKECFYMNRNYVSRRYTKQPSKTNPGQPVEDLLSEYRLKGIRHTNKIYICETCNERFTSSLKFKQHCLKHDITQPFLCDQCGNRFKNESALKVHYRSHTKEKPYQCHICGSAFSQSSTWSTHVQRHSGATPHKCDICGKLFAIKGDLRTHNRIHRAYRPFTCETCGNSFPRKSNYTRHLRKHTGEKPYACAYCEKRFARSEKCIEHQRLHTNERPFVCCECGASFPDSGNFSKHKKMHKEGKQPRKKRQQTASVIKSLKSVANAILSEEEQTEKMCESKCVPVLPKGNSDMPIDTQAMVINLVQPPSMVVSRPLVTTSVISNTSDVRNSVQFIKLSGEHLLNDTGRFITLTGENNKHHDGIEKKAETTQTQLSTPQHYEVESNSLNNQAYLMLDYFSRDSSLSFSNDGQLLMKNSTVFLQPSTDVTNNQNSLFGVPIIDAADLLNHDSSRRESVADTLFNRDNSSDLSSLTSVGQISLDINHDGEFLGRSDGDVKNTLDTNTFLNDDYLMKNDMHSISFCK